MSRTFFTADTHFGHEGIIRLCGRPFSSAREMDDAMVANWNAVVQKNDVIWHLGDFAHRADFQRMEGLFDRLHGRKFLIVGNHDDTEQRSLPWAGVQQFAEVSVEGERLVLFHYCLRVWPQQNRGAIHLYGHSHGRVAGTSRSVDVGVDCWNFLPVDLPQIRARLATLPESYPESATEAVDVPQP